MSYTPHTWTSGEVVTAAKMNALEQGAASGGGGYDLVLKCDNPDNILDGNVTLESGTFAAAYAKAMSGEPLSIMAYADNGDTNGERFVCNLPVLSWSAFEDGERIGVAVATYYDTATLESGDINTFLPMGCASVNITANGIEVNDPFD